MRARRKSLERSKPFISRCDLIDFQLHFSTRVHFSAGGCVELSLQWSKLYYYRRLLPEMSFVILELEQIGLSAFQGLWAQYYIPSSFPAIFSHLFLSLQMVLYIRSHWTQGVVICRSVNVTQTTTKHHFWHFIFTVCLKKSDKCETISKHDVPSNQRASQRLKLQRLLTKQSHTPIGNEVPQGSHLY